MNVAGVEEETVSERPQITLVISSPEPMKKLSDWPTPWLERGSHDFSIQTTTAWQQAKVYPAWTMCQALFSPYVYFLTKSSQQS